MSQLWKNKQYNTSKWNNSYNKKYKKVVMLIVIQLPAVKQIWEHQVEHDESISSMCMNFLYLSSVQYTQIKIEKQNSISKQFRDFKLCTIMKMWRNHVPHCTVILKIWSICQCIYVVYVTEPSL